MSSKNFFILLTIVYLSGCVMIIPYVKPEGDKAILEVYRSPIVENFSFDIFQNPDKCRNRQFLNITFFNEVPIAVNKPIAVGWDFTTKSIPGILRQACTGILQFTPEKDHHYLLSVEPKGRMCKVSLLDQTSYKPVDAITKKWRHSAWDQRGPWCE